MYQKKDKNFLQNMSPHLSQLNRNYLGEIICESSNWQHYTNIEDHYLGANSQLFRLERIAQCSYLILSIQNIKFYWFVMKIIKKFLLPISWYNRGLFPLGNKYFGVFVLNGLKWTCVKPTHSNEFHEYFLFWEIYSIQYRVNILSIESQKGTITI